MEGAHEEEKGTKACGCSELQVPPCAMLYNRKQTMVPSRASCLAWVEELGPLKYQKTVSGKFFQFFGEIRFINTIIIKAIIKAESPI